jgi:hypothetical protein
LELHAEDIIELELSCQFFSDISVSGPPRIEVDFLQNADVGLLAFNRGRDAGHLEAPLYVPIEKLEVPGLFGDAGKLPLVDFA